MRLLGLLAVLWGVCVAGAPLQRARSFPGPQDVYNSLEAEGGTAVLVPNAAVKAGGTPLGAAQPGLATPEACASACRAQPNCTWFQYCQSLDGCSLAVQPLDYQDCLLFSANCTEPDELTPRSQGLTAGFPARWPPVTVTGFMPVAGQGVVGADLECAASVVPDKCAVRSTEEALLLCLTTAECRGVTVFVNGTDGCHSSPLAFLKTEGLSPNNTFVSPGVLTLQPAEQRQVLDASWTESEASVQLPSAEEQVAADEAAPGSPAADTAWRGCIVGNGSFVAGATLAVLDSIPSAEACCRECRSRYAVPGGCTVWNYCGRPGGCSYKSDQMVRLASLRYQQCQLLYQELVTPDAGWPALLLARGAGVPFTAGAPLSVAGPPTPNGFSRLPGRGVAPSIGACDGSALAQTAQCWLPVSSVQGMADWCSADLFCTAFSPRSDSEGVDGAPTQGLFERDTSAANRLLIPASVMFVKQDVSGAPITDNPPPMGAPAAAEEEGGLSAAATAGIAVGSAAAGALVALALYLTVRRRRQRRAKGKDPAAAKSLENGGTSSGDTELSLGPCGGASGGASGSPPLLTLALGKQQDEAPGPELVPWPPPGSKQQQQQQQQQGSAAPPIAGKAPGGTRSVALAAEVAPPPISFAPASPNGDLLSPFAAAAGGFGSGLGTPTPPSREGSLPDPGAAGEQRDVLTSLGPGDRAGSAPAPAGQRQRRPPLPPAARAGSVPAGGFPSPAAPGPLGGAGSLEPRPPLWSPGREELGLQPQRSGSGSARSVLDTLPSGMLGRCSSGASLLRTQRTGSGALPELALFVAQQDAAAATRSGGLDETSTHLALSEATLPSRLREWVVDPTAVEYQRWPNGKLRDLGSGASGHVFRATYNGETIAAKEMDIGRSPSGEEAFLTEALRLQALRHPNVVGFYGVVLCGGKGVVLMEYCEGRDLQAALSLTATGGSQRLFAWQRRGRRVAVEIAKALNYLHSKGVVHMDVKSSNVLLTSGGTAKLADVAFSRELKGEVLPDVPFTGTFPWIAPEVLLGGRQCTQAVDIFSYGVLLWEIVTGELPRRGQMRMPAVPDECPQDVSDLIMECLSEDPDDRPTAPQLLQRLSAMLERGNGAAPRPRRSTESSTARAAAAAAAAASPAAAGATPAPSLCAKLDASLMEAAAAAAAARPSLLEGVGGAAAPAPSSPAC